jgi:hypothetical protein
MVDISLIEKLRLVLVGAGSWVLIVLWPLLWAMFVWAVIVKVAVHGSFLILFSDFFRQGAMPGLYLLVQMD